MIARIASDALARAVVCEKAALQLRIVARTMLNPPPGVRVELGGTGAVRFVGAPEAVAQIETLA